MTKVQDSRDLREEQNTNTINRPADGAGGRRDQRIPRIRELNDRLRTTGRGGMVVMTNGIAALGLAAVHSVYGAVAAFIDFNSDNDPWGEHDCAAMTVDGVRVIWKIDYFDRSRRIHSPDPADPNVTVRVLTVMLADEY